METIQPIWSDATANRQAESPTDLLRLFSFELIHCPRLEREEEYVLTRHTRSAWDRLLCSLQEHQDMAAHLPALRSSQPSEPDILQFLEQVEGKFREAQLRETSPHKAQLRLWLDRVWSELQNFRIYRDEMVRRNLRFVVMLARRYQNRGLNLLDLIQEGALGLMRAVEKFDPERKVAFSSYAVWWIRQAFTRALLHREEAAYWVDAPVDEDSHNVLVDLLTDPEAISPEEEIVKIDEAQGLQHALSILPPREAEIVRLRFGLVDGRAYTYEEIGLRLHLGRERVRLWEQRALLRLKHQMQPVAAESVGQQKPSRQKSISLQ
jgi:RNA polymerase sigma factor (sigma-70 family)